MVTPLTRKLLRDLWRRKGQVFTIALVVASGVACYVALRSTWVSLEVSQSTYYERYRFADVFATLERAPESVADRLEDVPGVARVETRVVENVMVPIDKLDEPAVGRLISLPSKREPSLNRLHLRSGRFVEPGILDEVVVVSTFADAHELVPGDRVPVVINGRLRQLSIVGIAMSPEYVFPLLPGDITVDEGRFAVFWMDRDILEQAYRMVNAFNDVSFALQPGADEREVIHHVDSILGPYGGLGAVARDKQISNYVLEGEISQLEQFATVIPTVFLLVAAFLLNIVLSRLVNLQRPQIATLKAVGYTNWEVGLHYLKLVVVIVVLGALVGSAVGAWFGDGLTGMYVRYFRFPTPAFRLTADVVATGVLVSVLAAVAGAGLAVYRVVRLPPAEAMRPAAPARYRPSWLERLGVHRLFGLSGLMVVREIGRRPWRTAMSALGISFSVAILVMGRFGIDSFDYMMDNLYHEQERSDTTVTFMTPQPARSLAELAALPHVLDVEGMRALPVRFRNENHWRDSVVYGLDRDARLRRVINRDGSAQPIPDTGIALTGKLAEVLRVDVGDPVQVEIREGNRQTRTVVVSALVDESFGMQGYMLAESVARLVSERETYGMALLRTDPSGASELNRRLKEIPQVARVVRKSALIDQFEQQSGEYMAVMTLILTGFAMTIAVGVVYNNARVTLSMRSRDLASLRVLGFTRGEISSVLLGELAVQMVIGIPAGLVMGRWWSVAIMSTVDPEVYRMPVVISAASYAFAVSIALVAGIASALLVRRHLDRLDLIGVLKTRE